MKKIDKKTLEKVQKKIRSVTVIVAAVVLFTALVAGITFIKTKNFYNKLDEGITEKKVEISGDTIRESMENIGKLCTAEYNYTHVEQADSSREINGLKIPFTTSSFIYSYDGTIMAGIDFTNIQIDKDDMGKKITITLPDVEIISSAVDQDSFRLYDEKNNIFNPISVTDVADTLADLKNSAEKEAVEKGLLNKAKENAIALVENFMHSTYSIEDYKMEVLFEVAE